MSGGEPSSIKRTLRCVAASRFCLIAGVFLYLFSDGIRPSVRNRHGFVLFLFLEVFTVYQALYRKWRPKTFDDVVGQSHITRTLKRQIMTDHLSHAYLFTGTRGTGKTTCAKLMAKAVNCQTPVEGNPCGTCPACLGIESASILDVVELDAASNNGVDQVRALRDEAVYAPAAVRRRVYIIDEVHMLSVGAFNALLKILEEPPEHVIFILATTELHKVPATILSRCQRFSFKRIQPTDIQNRLLYIAQLEGISLTEDGAAILSRLADGALRDALSLLDQCAISSQTVDKQAVLDALGLVGNTRTAHIMNAIRKGDTASALTELSDLYAAGKDVSALLSELAGLTRDLLLRLTTGGSTPGLMAGGYDEATMRALSRNMTPQRLLHNLNLIQETLTKLKTSADRRTDAELCLIRLCDKRLDGSVLSLSERLTRIEAAIATGTLPAGTPLPSFSEEPMEEPARPFVDSPPIEEEDPEAGTVEQAQEEMVPPPMEELPPAALLEEEIPIPEEAPPEPEEEFLLEQIPTHMPQANNPHQNSPRPKTGHRNRPSGMAAAGDPKFWQELSPMLLQQVGQVFYGYITKNLLTGLYDGERLTIYAPDEGGRMWLSNERDKQIIELAATAKAGHPVRVLVEVEPSQTAANGEQSFLRPQEAVDPMNELMAFAHTELGKEILTID